MTTFPKNFTWGAATSAYQIEGGWNAGQKGPSNWDAFCHDRVPAGSVGDIPGQVYTPGNVFQNQTGDVAADHYHRWPEDVAIMRDIGLQAYRFSIAWPRVIPGVDRKPSAEGLAFYDKLVDGLLAAGIQPWATLFHWDVPLWAWHAGAWLNRDIQHWFAEYAQVVVDKLSDRVTHWMTINEPQIFLGPSELEGLQTSNKRAGHGERLLAAHNCLLAHGQAVKVIRSRAKKPAQIGFAPIGRVMVPWSERLPDGGLDHADGRMFADPSPQNIDAARRATNATLYKDFWTNAWFADPIVFGRYPEDGLKLYGDAAPREVTHPAAGDMETIGQKIDFYGINVYDAELFRTCAPRHDNPCGPQATYEKVLMEPGQPRTAIGWNIIPEALYWGPKFLYEKYKLPIVVTENGLSCMDWLSMDGHVHDPQRIDYTRRYLLQLRRAIEGGADIRGYMHWSLLDNMEWSSGYQNRFGLVHVDFTTLKRTLKDSAKWYREVIRSNGSNL
ncbi:MAG: glycoside hydrolase family 1 protein [Phycisphaerales bacterium]